MQLWTPILARTLLPAFAGMLLLGFILRKWLLGKSRSIRLIPLQIIALLLVGLEIGKQVLSAKQGYDLYHIPLHFCSLFIFVIPVMAFYQGKHSKMISAVVTSLCTALFLMMMIYPNLIYSDGNVIEFFDNYFSFHTVFFHNLVLFAFVLILALELYEPLEKGEGKTVLLFILGYCVIAGIMAQVLKTNFNNFYSCNIPPLESVRVMLQGILGYGFTQFLYVVVVSLLDVGFLQLSNLLQRLLARGFRKL